MMIMSTNRILLTLCLLATSVLGLHAQADAHWQCDIHGFEYDMAAYFQLGKDNAVITDYADYEVAAFVGNECRGVAEFLSEDQIQYGYIRIRSNKTTGETVTFKVYQPSTGKTLFVTETIAFESLVLEGMPSSPKILHLADVLMGDVNGDEKVNSVDLSLMVDKILQIENDGFIDAAADLNNDGKINSVDLSLLINLILKIE